MFQTKFGMSEFDVNLLRGSTCCQPCRIALQPKGPREDLALQMASKPQKFKQNHNLCQSAVAATVSKRKFCQWASSHITNHPKKKNDRSLPPKPPYCDYSCWAAATSGHQALSAKTRRTAVEHFTKSTSVTLQTSENGFVSKK